MGELLSDCCGAPPMFDTERIDGKNAGICDECGENTEFHYEDGCYLCGGKLKKVGDYYQCVECLGYDEEMEGEL